MYLLIAGVIVAYLIGSFSSAVWIGRIFFHKDVRQYGSHNAGTTNTIRVLGLKPGIAVLLLDAFKGWAAVKMDFLFLSPGTEALRVGFDVALAVAVVLGHVFPLYTGFKGGKGVATLMGVVLALYPEAYLSAVLIFALVFLSSRYVSLASITAAVCFPFLEIFVFGQEDPVLQVFSIFMGLFIVITHRKNIARLLQGKESRLSLGKRPDPGRKEPGQGNEGAKACCPCEDAAGTGQAEAARRGNGEEEETGKRP